MSEEKAPRGESTEDDLRIVTTRLADLQRKCRSVDSRNHEATEMEQRIESILGRLVPSGEADADPIPFAELARELYAVERFFESNGFLSVAKEVAHVERTLVGLSPPDAPSIATPVLDPADLEVKISTEAASDDIETDDADRPSRWAVPKPLAAIMVFFVVALAICIVIIIRHNAPAVPEANTLRQPPPAPTSRPPTPSTIPTNPPGARAARPPGAILAEAVGKARLALAEGDVDQAIDELSRAALVDADHATVLGTANQIVNLLVDRAETAVDRGLWEIAELTLARAGRIATRYGLDTHRINSTARRYSQMARFDLVKPNDTAAIRASAGRRVTVFLKDGSNQESIIKGIEGGNLLLDEDTTVRGGAMYYVEKVPLGDIEYLKVWDE